MRIFLTNYQYCCFRGEHLNLADRNSIFSHRKHAQSAVIKAKTVWGHCICSNTSTFVWFLEHTYRCQWYTAIHCSEMLVHRQTNNTRKIRSAKELSHSDTGWSRNASLAVQFAWIKIPIIKSNLFQFLQKYCCVSLDWSAVCLQRSVLPYTAGSTPNCHTTA